MNENQVKGRIKEAEGKVKEITGKIVGNQKNGNNGHAPKNCRQSPSRLW
jgi:uncharacterized protein YjbJ (UPF0337 family)